MVRSNFGSFQGFSYRWRKVDAGIIVQTTLPEPLFSDSTTILPDGYPTVMRQNAGHLTGRMAYCDLISSLLQFIQAIFVSKEKLSWL